MRLVSNSFRRDPMNWYVYACLCNCTVVANNTAVLNPPEATKLGRRSIILSIIGVIVGVIILIISLSVGLTGCKYSYQGTCYNYKTYVGRSGSCKSGLKSPSGYCYSDCPEYEYAGTCYESRRYVSRSSSCVGGVRSPDGYCYTGASGSSGSSTGYTGSTGSSGSSPTDYTGSTGSSGSYTGATGSTGSSPVGPCTIDYPRCSSGALGFEVSGTCYKYRYYVYKGTSCYAYDRAFMSNKYCYYIDCPSRYTYRDICYTNRDTLHYSDYDLGRLNCDGVFVLDSHHCYHGKISTASDTSTGPGYRVHGSCYRYRYHSYKSCVGIKDPLPVGLLRSGAYCYYTSCPGYTYRGICYTNRDSLLYPANYTGYISCDGIRDGRHCYSGRISTPSLA